ncbi:CBBY-like protein [Eutrema salsugineum]|uniref:CBBY-like protein n=1 Tax=Eutrema salsugineum TaxID=72664 RepID=UPI000CED71B9|nr:CBBY-like protein [Eutrema salsugineum]
MLESKVLLNSNGFRAKLVKSIASRSGGITCSASSSPATLPSALLFDCGGVLVDIEKDGHRISFNEFRMTAYFNKIGWPEKAPKEEAERKVFIAGLHKQKTELFMVLIEKKLLPLRPGVAKLGSLVLLKL